MRLKAFIIMATEKAYGFSRMESGPVVWVPKSQVDYIRKLPIVEGQNREVVVDIPDWIIDKDSRAWEGFEEV